MHSVATMKKLREIALKVHDIEYCMVRVAGVPHSFVQMFNCPGMVEFNPDTGIPSHSIGRYFLSSVPVIMPRHGNWDFYMQKYQESCISGEQIP